MRVSRLDIARAARTLRRNWGFATVAILSLALAIALNTTMYSVLDGLVNPPSDVRDPDHLFVVRYFGDVHHRLPKGTVDSALATQTHSIQAVSGERVSFGQGTMVEHGVHARDVNLVSVAPNFFSVLGVRATAGRLFVESDAANSPAPVVISERLERELFPGGGSPIGQAVDVEGQPRPVIGVIGEHVLPPGWSNGLWTVYDRASTGVPLCVLRLRPDASLPLFEADLALIAARLAAAANESPRDTRLYAAPFIARQFQFKGFHYALIAAVLAVLLVACFNLANLQLARAIGRSRELALRAALGASRGDIIAHLLVESAILACAGLVLGLVMTLWGIHVANALIPETIADFVTAPQANWHMLVFAAVVAVVCVGVVGLVPAIRVSRADPNELLKSGAGTGAHRRNRQRYGMLVAAEIGLSLALLTGAALVLRSALRIREVRFGFDPTPIVTAYGRGSDTTGVIRSASLGAEIVDRLRAAPDVADAAVVFHSGIEGTAITVDDIGGGVREVAAPMWGYSVVSPSYLRTMGLRIVKGRDFSEGERDADLVVVDQRTARKLWPNSEAVGHIIKLGNFQSRKPWARVIGVVAEIMSTRAQTNNYFGALPSDTRLGAVYRVLTDRDSIVPNKYGFGVQVYARAKRNPERLPLVLRQQLKTVHGGVRAMMGESMLDALGITFERTRHDFVAGLFTGFALLGVGLAALGVFGIVAHSVAERRREIGVRIALGASHRNILHDVLREGNVLALAGIALGLLATKYDVGWLRAFYIDGEQYDAVLFAVMAVLLFAVTVVAAFMPALRATRVDPVDALRND